MFNVANFFLIKGDSGGPLVCEKSDGAFVLVGLTSWGSSQCTTAGAPSVFTRLTDFTSWIAETVANN